MTLCIRCGKREAMKSRDICYHCMTHTKEADE